jgi:hypothetical protein
MRAAGGSDVRRARHSFHPRKHLYELLKPSDRQLLVQSRITHPSWCTLACPVNKCLTHLAPFKDRMWLCCSSFFHFISASRAGLGLNCLTLGLAMLTGTQHLAYARWVGFSEPFWAEVDTVRRAKVTSILGVVMPDQLSGSSCNNHASTGGKVTGHPNRFVHSAACRTLVTAIPW